jgi:hypothetical protein
MLDLLDFLALTFYPKVPVAGMPIKKLHYFVHSKSKTSAIQACATPKDLRWNILMNMVKTASATIIIIIIEYNE